MIDPSSCENMISFVVCKMGLKIITHNVPYDFTWMHGSTAITITETLLCAIFGWMIFGVSLVWLTWMYVMLFWEV